MSTHFHTLNAAAAAIQVAHEITCEFFRPLDFHVHDGLEQNRPGLFDSFLESQRTRNLEGQLGRVYVVIRAVVEDDTKIDRRETRENAFLPGFLNPFLHGRNKIPRDRASEDFIYKFEIAASRKRLNADFAIAVLPVASALFLVLSLHVGFS